MKSLNGGKERKEEEKKSLIIGMLSTIKFECAILGEKIKLKIKL
jgi:hypothetical protein